MSIHKDGPVDFLSEPLMVHSLDISQWDEVIDWNANDFTQALIALSSGQSGVLEYISQAGEELDRLVETIKLNNEVNSVLTDASHTHHICLMMRGL